MRVTGINRIGEIYKTQQMKMEPIKTKKQDEVQLSTLAKDYQYALNAAKKLPDVRQKEVDTIKERISSGTYNVDMQEVSEKIMSRFDMKG
ncbi:flagellar biosynthesis anti-sigma factor FlgM [Niameybacter massiliensis]|uniref:flagellar biosynthesis anti-sigma factor FlgM n=1 Tax=Niameybacter massiliensis TaxID=1658108 RepID=UPI0006B57448|nr:flagellar biosynthesis anti-sigma factor FlgM [Niameybacter massiliensis]